MIVRIKAFHCFLGEPIHSPLLQLRGIGYRQSMPPTLVDRPHGTGDVLIMYFHDPAWLGDCNDDYPMPAGQIVVWEVGAAHHYGHRSRRWRHSWVHCGGAAIVDALRQTGMSLGRPRDLSDPTIISHAVLALHAELSGPYAPNPAILANTLDTLIRRLARDTQPDKNSAAPPPGVLLARRHLERFCDQPLTLDDLADHAGHVFVPATLRPAARRHADSTPHDPCRRASDRPQPHRE